MSQLGYHRMRSRQAARIFTARYESRCALCPERIMPGDDATYVDEHLAHAGCPGPGGAE